MRKVLLISFFDQPTLAVAENLLGKYLVRQIGSKQIALMINEVEAYDGPHDKACHGRFGKTKRTVPMFGSAGRFYVYFVYGMYWMLNVVVGPKEYPAALLIRGAGEISGPGRLTKRLSIDKHFNEKGATKATGLWFEDRGVQIKKSAVVCTPRIGIDYAGAVWSSKPYRFILSDD